MELVVEVVVRLHSQFRKMRFKAPVGPTFKSISILMSVISK